MDEKTEREIKKIKPDFRKCLNKHLPAFLTADYGQSLKLHPIPLVLCDQVWMQPAMVNAGCPYAFIVSEQPVTLDFDGLPKCYSDARTDDAERIKQFREKTDPFFADIRSYLDYYFEKRNTKYDGVIIPTRATGDNFIIFMYPEDEIGYFSEELKKKYNLFQIDSPLFPARIPKPYKLPANFATLPGKIVYLSMGSLFSAYTHRLQKIVDVLETYPEYKYIVSCN